MSQTPANIEQPGQVDCLMIPLNDRQLLLPNVTVAEIIPFSQLMTTNSRVDWIIGSIQWRGIGIPVICYELLNGTPAPRPSPDARFAIINGVGQYSEMPFFGILVQGIPKLTRVLEQDIQQVDAVMGMGSLDQMAVSVEGESAFIPDLEQIETQLLGLL
ncbi:MULTISPECIES: chemotaxis protein CheW [unclassified Oceanobacter]|jgi:chemosensory pili system protein ChpC|uniref:chemotaxis protein CheW n=1 Tax=unclassified Oceanobacter TaxID=2620260 RepID=UPI0026E379D6|nr:MULTISPECIES: chemotaxis protein CheW [unclassified Oceanobacter]MDO6683342.1 chemotaxis protein CheW [Oceanobacter sp. 5_MG-2023]MDP2507108.1 chemotaxis protein CheW [Oceanobacter sp. 3_MG-2023]MDP2549068.1 chemotaxis protein CheW [Oceanobacter sp. 4_MG-2023]MDP2609900.1 chemotaxis protein CheW [Oceanobacter sp. 1_MG-2023]MDP2613218.1 chemotaxis protein CheW [Oceanobacter sp. 2_MG-2023]